MKKFKWVGLCLILTLLPFLQSCLNDSNAWPEDTSLALVTIREKEADELINFSFVLDNGKTINPISDTNLSYDAKDGQRAFAYIRLFDKKSVKADNNYDYNAEVFYIENILTKDIIELTTANADSIGNDYINITNLWAAQGYITMECQFYVQNNLIKHMLNLVHNTNYPIIDEEGYIGLECRHNAFYDFGTELREGIVSFKLDNVEDYLESAKGIKVYVNTQNGIISYKLDLENHTQPNTRNTSNMTEVCIY